MDRNIRWKRKFNTKKLCYFLIYYEKVVLHECIQIMWRIKSVLMKIVHQNLTKCRNTIVWTLICINVYNIVCLSGGVWVWWCAVSDGTIHCGPHRPPLGRPTAGICDLAERTAGQDLPRLENISTIPDFPWLLLHNIGPLFDYGDHVLEHIG